MRLQKPTLISLALISAAIGLYPVAGQDRTPSVAPAGLPSGFLARSDLPNSLQLLPPPPARGSAAFSSDEAEYQALQFLREGPRWRLAGSDADLSPAHVTRTFSCAAGVAISKENTPETYGLLMRSLVDIGLSTYAAKDHYRRERPFVTHGSSTCFPSEDAHLREDGSYPSGHSAIGWGWALILAELVPGKASSILGRGREFGQSRAICGAHWQSDVDAGRLMAAATVARLHGEAAFRKALQKARRELSRARLDHKPDEGSCGIEAAALQQSVER